MKKVFLILTLFLLFINPCFSASSVTKKDISVQTSDGFTIKATLEYPKIKGKTNYNTVVLLHSLGYSSQWWESLPEDLIDNGYAVLLIDLRGHGKSIYNSKLVRTSWKNLTNSAYVKYPDDVASVIEYVKTENTKKTFFNNWAIIGSDIGAATAVLAADKLSYKPKTIVLISPIVKAKGLYIPVKLANLNIDILSIYGKNDISGSRASDYLKKFAQAAFGSYSSESNSSGMLLLKNDASLSGVITAWIKEYL